MNSRGSALVIVLAVSSILFLGCLFLVKVARESVNVSQCLMDKLDALMRAESTVDLFKFVGATGRFGMTRLINHLTEVEVLESLAPAPEKVAGVEVQKGIPLDGTIVELPEGIELKAVDAGAKLNVWGWLPSCAGQVLELAGADRVRVNSVQDSLLDWFDRDDLKRLNGAESYYYRSERKSSFGPRNCVPQSVDELALVRGFDDPKIWDAIKNDLVIAPGAQPNLNTMGKDVFRGFLGITEETADHLLALRGSRGYLNFYEVASSVGLSIDGESLSSYASRVVDLEVGVTTGKARESVRCLVSFRPDRHSPFQVLEYYY